MKVICGFGVRDMLLVIISIKITQEVMMGLTIGLP